MYKMKYLEKYLYNFVYIIHDQLSYLSIYPIQVLLNSPNTSPWQLHIFLIWITYYVLLVLLMSAWVIHWSTAILQVQTPSKKKKRMLLTNMQQTTFWLDLRPSPLEETHACYCKSDQVPMIVGPKVNLLLLF